MAKHLLNNLILLLQNFFYKKFYKKKEGQIDKLNFVQFCFSQSKSNIFLNCIQNFERNYSFLSGQFL